MNKNIDLTKILKDCPKGTEFWSIAHGVVSFQRIDLDKDFQICMKCSYGDVSFTKEGQYFTEGECILIPSKDQRDWSKFTASWYTKEKFNPKEFQPFDKVLIRDDYQEKWRPDFFSHITNDISYRYATIIGDYYACCIPYNDDTKHLVDTKEEAPEYYQYWSE